MINAITGPLPPGSPEVFINIEPRLNDFPHRDRTDEEAHLHRVAIPLISLPIEY